MQQKILSVDELITYSPDVLIASTMKQRLFRCVVNDKVSYKVTNLNAETTQHDVVIETVDPKVALAYYNGTTSSEHNEKIVSELIDFLHTLNLDRKDYMKCVSLLGQVR